jgi:transposase-like protein
MSKKPTPKENKKYTAEFKSEAIKLAEPLSVAEAAKKLGIYASQIYSWRSALNNSRTGVERESQVRNFLIWREKKGGTEDQYRKAFNRALEKIGIDKHLVLGD